MDRNTIVGILLIATILIGYSLLTKPDREEIAERQRIADSLNAENLKQIAEREAKAAEYKQDSPAALQLPSAGNGVIKTDDLGVFSSLAQGQNDFYELENSFVKLIVSTKGGRPYAVQLKDYLKYDGSPIILFDGDSTHFGLEFFSDGRSIKTNDLFFNVDAAEKHQLANDKPVSIILKLPVGAGGAFIEYTYTLYPESYFLDFNLRMVGLDEYRTDNVQLAWQIYSPQQEMGRVNEENYTNLNYRYFEGDVEKFKQRSKKELQDITETTKIHWVGFVQQFFSSVILADQVPFEGGYMAAERLPEASPYIRKFTTELSVPFDRTANFNMPMHFYFGPNHFQTLKKIGFSLEDNVTLGTSLIKWINQFAIIPIFNWLGRFISNYGIIIFLLTLIIKVALFPLTFRSYFSQAKMRVLKPQIDEINQKIPKEK